MTTRGTTIASFWEWADTLASRTPSQRNRYVDFLRAVSIIVVVVGHWLIAAPYVRDGELVPVNLLGAEPWTHWLTWAFQVMPIFFMVGGFANAASWRPNEDRYAVWLTSRLRRLVIPAIPLVVVWSGIAAGTRLASVDGALLEVGSQSALIPLWFLAVYVLVVAMTPFTHALWRRFGWLSFVGIAAGAVVVDLGRFNGADAIGWANFVFVWLAVHQLGYAWRDGRLERPIIGAFLGLAGIVALAGLVGLGPYPVAMVGVPGAAATNNSPPTVALLALGMFQTGALVAIERPMRRWLERRTPWTATVAMNGMIMSVYLWHLTVMVLIVGLSLLFGGFGMQAFPASPEWWATRPVWIVLLTALSVPVVASVRRFERPPQSKAAVSRTAALAAGVLACVGFANIAGGGIGNADVWLRPAAVLPVLIAALVLAPQGMSTPETREPRGV